MNEKLSKLLTYFGILILSLLLLLYLFTNNIIVLLLAGIISIFISTKKIKHFGIILFENKYKSNNNDSITIPI